MRRCGLPSNLLALILRSASTAPRSSQTGQAQRQPPQVPTHAAGPPCADKTRRTHDALPNWPVSSAITPYAAAPPPVIVLSGGPQPATAGANPPVSPNYDAGHFIPPLR